MLGNGFASGGGGGGALGRDGGSSFDGVRWGVKLSVNRTGLDCGCGMWGIVACGGWELSLGVGVQVGVGKKISLDVGNTKVHGRCFNDAFAI